MCVFLLRSFMAEKKSEHFFFLKKPPPIWQQERRVHNLWSLFTLPFLLSYISAHHAIRLQWRETENQKEHLLQVKVRRYQKLF